MIRLISHRNNMNGPDSYENTVCKMDVCLSKGYDCEIDVWSVSGSENVFQLGHDYPIPNQSIPLRFLEDSRIWCHCKDERSYEILSKNPLVNCFKHTDENWVKTSQGYIWVHSRWNPGMFIDKFGGSEFLPAFSDMSKFVFTWFVDKPKSSSWNMKDNTYSICSDFVESYKE